MSECRTFDATELLPPEWRRSSGEGPVRTFNPGLVRDGEGWLFAYRVVAPDGLRRIALSRLDRNLRVVADSAIALTDLVRFRAGREYPTEARTWFADPRLYRLQGRLFVYWNSGWHEPRNWQFLQELDAATLRPIGHPREMVLRGERRKLEKNWTLFAPPGGGLFAVYSITPHRILQCSLEGDSDIEFHEFAQTAWSQPAYPENHGGLRGGAPAVLARGEFWSFCHSVHTAPEGYRYAAAAYRFAATPPFAPTSAPFVPLDLGQGLVDRRAYPRLNPAVGRVIYPCGAAHDGARWLISHGINDEQCAISLLSEDEVAASQQPSEPARS